MALQSSGRDSPIPTTLKRKRGPSQSDGTLNTTMNGRRSTPRAETPVEERDDEETSADEQSVGQYVLTLCSWQLY